MRNYGGTTAPSQEDGIATATLCMMVIIVLAVLTPLQRDDGTIFLALILSVAQSIVILIGTQHGPGRPEASLNEQQVVVAEKDLYAPDILYALCISLAKLSVLQLLRRLAVDKWHRRVAHWSLITVIMWTIPMFFSLVFLGGASSHWDTRNSSCINVFVFWVAVSLIDLLTEIVICILPKATVVVAFLFRAVVLVATIIRLCYLHNIHSPNVILSTFETIIATPYAFGSGMLNVALQQTSGADSYSDSYVLGGFRRATKISTAAFAVGPPGRPFANDEFANPLIIQGTD
ncbi:hypothetical protein BDV23DRAFT_175037 [Aspergillus alliaceus]|uniref:Rhodopsin domain-containing protein n=1 Tax=Petromyces alliaceus TaxID=209559 RepID=A0A5N7BZU2_PETAA|nr:hypothetical protein BDV23DRAFT_175037 [Aspergillus alliaceus]